MKAHEFVNALRAAEPSLSAVKKLGLTTKGAERIRKLSYCRPRKIPRSKERGKDELLELFRRWHMGKVTIGMVVFQGTPIRRGKYIELGLFEVDKLVLEVETGEVLTLDDERPGQVCCLAAINSERFLEALAVAQEHFCKAMVDEDVYNDLKGVRRVREQCTKIAGGKRFRSFYVMLFGE